METKPGQEIREIANRDYSGREEQAFPHWALSCLLGDQQPERDDLREHVAVGNGDLGIDAYWIDETNRRLILLQAKYAARVRRDEATSFRAAIEALINEEYVLEQANQVIREIYPELLEALIDDSFTIQAVLACGGRVAPAARAYARAAGSQNWQFVVRDANHTKEIQLQVLNIEELSAIRDDFLRDVVEPFVAMPVTTIDNHPSFHFMGGDFRAVQATVPARVLVDAYDEYRSTIFRLNPRGPLGSNKVNKEIEGTLKDPGLKGLFHLLNNGLTTMCSSVVHNQATQNLEITNFQVVNGCQTVFTLHNMKEHVTDDVKITVRVVEGLHEPWANHISKASNYQTSVRPEQLASLREEHDVIKTKMDRLDPPWFYERQKGFVQFLTLAGRRSHRQRYGRRSASASDVGQYGLAFLGYPSLAKYDLQRLFDGPDEESQRLYRLIFMEDNQAAQLILPVVVGRRVIQAVKEQLGILKAEAQNTREQTSELSWLPFAKMHITALIGKQLEIATAREFELLDAAISRERLASIDTWFDDMFRKAKRSVAFEIRVEIRVAEDAGKLLDRREFFRDKDRYHKMAEDVGLD